MLRHSVPCTIWPNRKGVYWGGIWTVYIIELADAKRLECLGNGEQPYDVSGRLSSSGRISSAGASSEGASSGHASPWDASEGDSGGVSSAILAQPGIASLIAPSGGQLEAESNSLLIASSGRLLGSFLLCLWATALFAFFPIIALGRIPCILFGYR